MAAFSVVSLLLLAKSSKSATINFFKLAVVAEVVSLRGTKVVVVLVVVEVPLATVLPKLKGVALIF